MKTKPNTNTTTLSPLELRRKIAVREAAELNGVSEATFRRHYGHLIRKISARRDVVELRDALELPAKRTAETARYCPAPAFPNRAVIESGGRPSEGSKSKGTPAAMQGGQ
jgi:hypothetical protein